MLQTGKIVHIGERKNGRPPLWVCCASMTEGRFSDIKETVREAVCIVRNSQDYKTGVRPEIVVLFSESAVSAKYEIWKDDVQKQVDGIALREPDLWVACCFSVLELAKGNKHMAGYFIAPDSWVGSQKRDYGRTDLYVIQKSIFWREDGDELCPLNLKLGAEAGTAQSARLASPSGRVLEHCTCSDIYALPLKEEPEVISLVSAQRLISLKGLRNAEGLELLRVNLNIGNMGSYEGMEQDFKEISKRRGYEYVRPWGERKRKRELPLRKAVVVNDDDCCGALLMTPGGESSWSIKGSKFLFIPILD